MCNTTKIQKGQVIEIITSIILDTQGALATSNFYSKCKNDPLSSPYLNTKGNLIIEPSFFSLKMAKLHRGVHF